MHGFTKMSFLALAALGTLGLASAASACGDNAVAHPASWDGKADAGLFHNADYEGASIVGMWDFKMTTGGNPFDFGYIQWHSDGTELTNSASRSPATENFCMGVWKQTGPSRYHLNHFALSYDASGALNARVNIKQDVVVDGRGATYSGQFTADIYSPGGALLQHVAGQVTAQRVAAY